MAVCCPFRGIRFLTAVTLEFINIKSGIITFAGSISQINIKYCSTVMTNIMVDASFDVGRKLSKLRI